ncbi:MAG: DUF4097 domain-containing protein [bacterium]
MRKIIILLIVSIFGFITAISSYGLPLNYERQVEKHFKVKKGGTLYLKSDRGSVDIRSHKSEEVDVVVLLEADTRNKERAEDWFERFDLAFDQRGADVEILGRWENGWFHRRNRLKVKFEIRVPKNYNLDIDTAGGSIWVDDLIGDVKLNTSGGSINLGQIEGPVKAETSGGNISLERATGQAYLHTSGGSISVGEVDGELDAKTSGGSISVDGVNGDLRARTSGGGLLLQGINGNLEASTSGGSIRAEMLKQIEARAELRTSGGSIILTINPELQADLDASTSGGRIVTDVPLTIKGTFKKTSIRGKLNGGGELITLRTSGGNIEIRER